MAAARRPWSSRQLSRRPPTAQQQNWLSRGLEQPGGKLPLFDEHGQLVKPRLINACLKAGWAERWFDNPLKPDWLVCRLTDAGRDTLLARLQPPPAPVDSRQGELI